MKELDKYVSPEVDDQEVIDLIESVPVHEAWTEELTQSLTLQGGIPASNAAAGTYYSSANTNASYSGVNMNIIRRLTSLLHTGVLGASANIQIYFQASANANMAGNSNVLDGNGNAYSLVATNSNAQYSIELRADQLPAGTQYVQTVAVVNTAASNFSLTQIGGEGAYKPVSQLDPPSVVISRTVMPVP